MELLEGEDLAARIERTGPMSPKDAARLVCQLSKGLTRAHLLGLVHRNLKPGNIFLEKGENEGEFQAKILDLGLSVRAGISAMGRTTSDAAHMICPEFMSPEQIFGVKDVDFRADLWTLAVVAYYALTGRVPFSGKNLEDFSRAIEDGQFEAPSTLVPGLASAVDHWFTKALQRDPVARFGGAKELADEFDRAIGAEPSERTSRTSLTNMGQRISSTSVVSTASKRRPTLPSQKEISDRIPVPASLRAAALAQPEAMQVTVTLAPQPSKSSSATVILILAIAGIATIGAGLALLSGGHNTPQHPPAANTPKD